MHPTSWIWAFGRSRVGSFVLVDRVRGQRDAYNEKEGT